MKRISALLLTLLLFLISIHRVEAKARLVAVFPLRSTPELTARASEATRTIASAFAAVEGYDAKIVPNPTTGSLGVAAASVGASIYVVGQLLVADSGYQLILASFEAATDKGLGDYRTTLKSVGTLPDSPDIKALLSAGTSSIPRSAVSLDRPGVGLGGGAGSQAQILNQAGNVTVPTGLAIPLTLAAPISSGAAQVGDKFAFVSSKDVVVDGFVVVRKGAQGEGQIATVERAGGNGHPGKLGLQFNWIAAIDGSKIQLTDTPRADEGEAKQGAASTATIATYILLGPLGLFAHNFVKGRDITLDDKTKISAYVDHTVLIGKPTIESTEVGFAPAPGGVAPPAPLGSGQLVPSGPSGASLTPPVGALRGNSSTGDAAFDSLTTWTRSVPFGGNATHSASWSLAAQNGQPAQSLTLANDDTAPSLVEAVARIKTNLSDSRIVVSVDSDVTCQNRPSHLIAFVSGPAGIEVVTNRLLVSRPSGLTTITYVRPKNVPYDSDVKRAIDGYCAA